ncbi:MAG: BlaI/MecI/CopY family transcriptional regulator [Gemmatimonadota bacterium]|nr:BlaI/MecI/CopY family transcriptional regulator [Gemmatimonadota bacterium]
MTDPRQTSSPRERQILDAVYALGEATVREVRRRIPDPPGYDAVRTTMRILEEKGLLAHRRDGRRYVYRPTVPPRKARGEAMRHLVETFFDASPEAAALAFLRMSDAGDDPRQTLDRLWSMLQEEGES